MRLCWPAVVAALLFSGTGCGPKPTSIDDFSTRPVTLPNGDIIRAETASDNVELLRGLMFRSSLAPDHGMLFVYPHPDHYQAVMYQNEFPLDMIWMDARRRIVSIDENVPPCKTKASLCPKYGGKQVAAYLLEISAGLSRKYHLQPGQTIQW